MKTMYILRPFAIALCAGTLFSCTDYLDKEPLSEVTPDKYLNDENQLASYANALYVYQDPSHNYDENMTKSILPQHGAYSYGTFEIDNHTDNQAGMSSDNKYVPGLWKVPQKDDDNWFFENIRSCNYFLRTVLPKYETGEITGSDANIRHYIGEIYFLRSYEYFKRYQQYGDFPIVTEPLADNLETLIEANKRMPRNEVARFILQSLDSAVTYMSGTRMASTRASVNAALLLKSRVALFEGTWLKYFKGTPFVPGGAGWPGQEKSYNAGYAYPTGNIDSEIAYFLDAAKTAAKTVADEMTGSLTSNTGSVQQSPTEPANPYMEMFADEDLSTYPEVILWRPYSKGLGKTHCVVVAAQWGDYGVGATRGLVDGFLMANGLPAYASGSGYAGDQTIADVRKNRDPRLTLFLKEPGQTNILFEDATGDHAVPVEPYPDITNGNAEKGYSTGYALRKGGSFYQNQCANNGSYTGSITLRGVEALLNYIEACYEQTGALDGTAQSYWKTIRQRAGLDTDFTKTIAATNMTEEAKNDWGAYSAGTLIDPTLYNIRRERRCELMAEGLRFMDLCRWRAMDQMISTPYHIEGIHLWNTPMQAWYGDLLVDDESDAANVSSHSRSEYLRPYEKNTKSNAYNGYRWAMAHYLRPLPVKQFLLTASDGSTIADSPLYQNPYWPTVADQGAEQ